MVNSPEEAKRVVDAVKYPPVGKRGVGLARAQGYGTRFAEYRDWLAAGSAVIVQIEHIQAVENLDAILAVPGVDGFIVGPYDLSASLGTPGDFQNPRMLEALAAIREASKRTMAGIHVVHPDPAQVRERVAEGYGFVAYSVDFLLLGEACRGGMKDIQSWLKEGKQ
jgi:2-dehydro-3-deoxyglucarate aldolase